MPLSDKMRKMIDLARARAATIALLKRIAQRPATPAAKPNMLTETERERLRRNAGETREFREERHRVGTYTPPAPYRVFRVIQGGAESESVLQARRERLQRNARRTIEYCRTEFAKLPRPDLDNLPPEDETK